MKIKYCLCCLFFVIVQIVSAQKSNTFVIKDSIDLKVFHDSVYVLAQQGQFQKAIDFCEIGVDYFKKEKNWKEVLHGQYVISYCYRNLSEWNKAITVSKQAIGLAKEEFPKEGHKEMGNILDNLGIVYLRMGKYEKALDSYQKALKSNLHFYGKNSLYGANSFMSIGLYHLNIEKFEKAADYLQQTIDIYKSIGQEFSADCGNTFINAATAQLYLGNYKESLRLIDKSIAIYLHEFDENYYLLANSYQLKGSIYLAWKEFDLAQEYLQRGLAISRKTYGDPSLYTALLEVNLGDTYLELKQYQKALRVYEEALDFHESNQSNDVMVKITLYNNMGVAQKELKNYESALKICHKTFDVIEKSIGEFPYSYSQALYSVGLIQSEIGNTREAIKYMFEAYDNLSTNLGKTHPALQNYLYSLSSIYLELGKLDSALTFAQKGIQLICPNHLSLNIFENPDCAKKYASGTDINLEIQLIDQKAQILEQIWQNKKEDNTLLMAALKACEWGKTILEQRNKVLDFSTNNETGFNFLNLSKTGFRIAHILYQQTSQQQYLEKVFEFIELGKAIQLQEALVAAKIKSYADIPDSLLQKEKDLKREKKLYESKLKEALEANDSANIIHYRDEKLFSINRIIEKFNQNITNTYPVYAQKQGEWSKSIQLVDIQKVLDENTLFVEYVFPHSESLTKELSIMCLDKKGTTKIIQVPLQKGIKEEIQSFNKLLQSFYLTRLDKRKQFIKQSHQFYQQFIQPIENQLIKKEKIVIIGEGITNYIPFEVLLKNEKLADFSQLDYLIKDYEISYHYSGKLYVNSQSKEEELFGGNLLAFAPVFNKNGESEKPVFASRTISDTTLRAYTKDGDFTPLYYTETEVKAIGKHFQKKRNTSPTLLLFEEANEQNLKTELEKNYQYIHLASHSFSNVNQPDFSGIACWLNKEDTSKVLSTFLPQKEDGLLYVGEVYDLSISADLVVLSSCESGFGKLVSGEGMLGLNRSFIYAGVPNVLFSLWKVNDKNSSELMIDFYDNMLAGNAYSSALRKAKLKRIRQQSTASPNLWSSFLLMGR